MAHAWNRRRSAVRASLTLLTLGIVACETSLPSEIATPSASSPSSAATLIECPTNQARSTSGTISPLGGTLTLGGHRVVFPGGAVLLPVTVTLAEPISNFMEISLNVDGAEHFEFNVPVTVTLSYERCTRSNLNKASLEVWHIDETTKALLENMGGEDDKVARAVTFDTRHFSGYVLAE